MKGFVWGVVTFGVLGGLGMALAVAAVSGWWLARLVSPPAGAARPCPPGVPEHARLDLHQGLFDADERAIGVGVRVLVAAAYLAFP